MIARSGSGIGWFLAAILLSAAVGCSSEPAIPLDAPEGWATDERGRWWIPGTDTSRAFRNLDTFEAMGARVPDAVYQVGVPISAQPVVARERMVSAVQRELVALYRNRPETVDSLFWQYVAPTIEAPNVDRDPTAQVKEYEREAWRRIARHFRAPGALTHIGTDIPVVIPDSLAVTGAGQAAAFQVYVDSAGFPAAIREVQSVHPILDRIALRAVAQVRWQPAYILRTTRSVAVDSWVRFAVRFPEPITP